MYETYKWNRPLLQVCLFFLFLFTIKPTFAQIQVQNAMDSSKMFQRIFLNPELSVEQRLEAGEQIPFLNVPEYADSMQRMIFDKRVPDDIRLHVWKLFRMHGYIVGLSDVVDRQIRDEAESDKYRGDLALLFAEEFEHMTRFEILRDKEADRFRNTLTEMEQTGPPYLRKKAAESQKRIDQDIKFYDFENLFHPMITEGGLIKARARIHDEKEDPALRARYLNFMSERIWQFSRTSLVDELDVELERDARFGFSKQEFRDVYELGKWAAQHPDKDMQTKGTTLIDSVNSVRYLLFYRSIYPIFHKETSLPNALKLMQDTSEEPELREKAIDFFSGIIDIYSKQDRIPIPELENIESIMTKLQNDPNPGIAAAAKKTADEAHAAKIERIKHSIFPIPREENSLENYIAVMKDPSESPDTRATLLSFLGDQAFRFQHNNLMTPTEIEDLKKTALDFAQSGEKMYMDSAMAAMEGIQEARYDILRKEMYPNPTREEVDRLISVLQDNTEDPAFRARVMGHLSKITLQATRMKYFTEDDLRQFEVAANQGLVPGAPAAIAGASKSGKKEFQDARFWLFRESTFPSPSKEDFQNAIDKITNPDEAPEFRARCLDHLGEFAFQLMRSEQLDTAQLRQLGNVASKYQNDPDPDVAGAAKKAYDGAQKGRYEWYKGIIYPYPKEGQLEESLRLVQDEKEDPKLRADLIGYMGLWTTQLARNNQIDMNRINEFQDVSNNLMKSPDPTIADSATAMKDRVRKEKIRQFEFEVYPQPQDDKSIEEALALFQDDKEESDFKSHCMDYFGDGLEHLTRTFAISEDQIKELDKIAAGAQKDPALAESAKKLQDKVKDAKFLVFERGIFPAPVDSTSVSTAISRIQDDNEDTELRSRYMDLFSRETFKLARSGELSDEQLRNMNDFARKTKSSDNPALAKSAAVALDSVENARIDRFKKRTYPTIQDKNDFYKGLDNITDESESPRVRAEELALLNNQLANFIHTDRITEDDLNKALAVNEQMAKSSDPMIAAAAKATEPAVKEARFMNFRKSIYPEPRSANSIQEGIDFIKDETQDSELRAKYLDLLGRKTDVMFRSGKYSEQDRDAIDNMVNWAAYESQDPTLSKLAKELRPSMNQDRFLAFRRSVFPKPVDEKAIPNAIKTIKDENVDEKFRADALVFLAEKMSTMEKNGMKPSEKEQIISTVKWAKQSSSPTMQQAGVAGIEHVLSSKIASVKRNIYPSLQPDGLQKTLDFIKNDKEEPAARGEVLKFLASRTNQLIRTSSINANELSDIYKTTEWAIKSNDKTLSSKGEEAMAYVIKARVEPFKQSIFPRPKSPEAVDEAIALIRNKDENVHYRAECLAFLAEKVDMLTRSQVITSEQTRSIIKTLEWAKNSDEPVLAKRARENMGPVYNLQFNEFKKSVYPRPIKDGLTDAIILIKNKNIDFEYRAQCAEYLGEKLPMLSRAKTITQEEYDEVVALFKWCIESKQTENTILRAKGAEVLTKLGIAEN